MWSVGLEARLELGAADDPLRQLEALAEQARGRSVRLVLHAALCCPVPFDAASAGSAASSSKELTESLRTAAAAHLAVPADRLVVAFDPRDTRTVAALPVMFVDAARDWAARCGARLVSMRPAWNEGGIEFLPDRRPLVVWAVTALLAGMLLGFSFWKGARQTSELASMRAGLVQAEERSRAEARASRSAREPARASAARAAALLQWDANKAFAVMENVSVPQARLISADVDVAAQTIRLDYELASLKAVPAITSILNTGYDAQPPWRLQSAASASASGDKYRASWSASLQRL